MHDCWLCAKYTVGTKMSSEEPVILLGWKPWLQVAYAPRLMYSHLCLNVLSRVQFIEGRPVHPTPLYYNTILCIRNHRSIVSTQNRVALVNTKL